ncbi:hypothetical protein ACFL56_03965, partial [Candidatus Margulisiibacteriota bacterium]
ICPGEAYPVLAGALLMIQEDQEVLADDILARESASDEEASKTKDIIQGLPRVEELFEARKPRNAALLARIDGTIEIKESEGLRKILVRSGTKKDEHKVPYGTRIKVFPGKHVKQGEILTEGTINPHDLLDTLGVVAAQEYITEEVQKVYRSQGVTIHDKHIEVIVRQMTNRIRVEDTGDTRLQVGELVDIVTFNTSNKNAKVDEKAVAKGSRVLLGITKASLNTDSLISAASFQETTSVLAAAAIRAKRDPMYGLKENVIVGKLIPSGTGQTDYRYIELFAPDGESLEPLPEEEEAEVVEEAKAKSK